MTEKQLEQMHREQLFIIGLTRLCNKFGFYVEGEIFKSYYDKMFYEDITLDYEERGILIPVFLEKNISKRRKIAS